MLNDESISTTVNTTGKTVLNLSAGQYGAIEKTSDGNGIVGNITGGTFSNSVNPTYLADGLKYEVCAGGKYSYYSDFDTAAAAATADGHEVIKVGNSGTGVVPFYIDYADGTNSYYYYPSTSDTTTSTTTKGSPKTFDAGVGIYAVTALLSVTGMAWAGKKRH